MGAANAMAAFATYGAKVGDQAMRVLVYMCLVARDGDAEPWFGLGHEALSEMALGTPVPDRVADPKGHEAALRAVRRAITSLQAAGAIRTAERARFGTQLARHVRYRLYPAEPAAQVDRKATPPDEKRPMAPAMLSVLRLLRPPDEIRPMEPRPPDEFW